jgi:hypothetical protein
MRSHDRQRGLWIQQWEQGSATLFHLLQEIENGGVEEASAVLRRVRECRETWGEPPDPELRPLVHRVLHEVWEAARAALYGDLERSRQHSADAVLYAQEIRDLLGSGSV